MATGRETSKRNQKLVKFLRKKQIAAANTNPDSIGPFPFGLYRRHLKAFLPPTLLISSHKKPHEFCMNVSIHGSFLRLGLAP